MKKHFLILFIVFSLYSCESQEAIDVILSNHLEKIGIKSFEFEKKGFQFNGTILLEPANLSLDFSYSQLHNKIQEFDQKELEHGMNLVPGMKRVLNEEGAFFIVDESKMNMGLKVDELDDEAVDIWKETETTSLSPLYYFKKLKYPISLVGTDRFNGKEVYILNVGTPSKNNISIYINKETSFIEGLKFTTYHPQLGKVPIERTILSYGDKAGFKYPNKWLDKRGGTNLTYTIKQVAFINELLLSSNFENSNRNKSAKLNNESIQVVINDYAKALNNFSPFNDSNSKITSGLNLNFNQGKYSSIDNVQSLSSVLSNDIIELTGDHHFGIDYNPRLFEAITKDEEDNSEENSNMDALMLKEEKENNFFIDEASTLKNGYFYLKIRQIPRIKYAKKLIDSLMFEASNRKGLIIDLRNNTGGAAGFNTYLASHLLPKKTMLFERVTNKGAAKVFTQDVPEIDKIKSLPVYILVNNRTVSAGEQLAYLLQNHKRATLIGSKTFGAAHGSIDVPLSNGLIGLVPMAYEKHITTQKDWEGTGVIPDLKVDSTAELESFLKKIKR